MVTIRPFYRVCQFWHALTARPDDEMAAQAARLLSAPQMALFARLTPGEQAHSLDVLRRVMAGGERHPDLLVAALLHDVGKCLSPLKAWERALIVVMRAIAPRRVAEWGRCDPAEGTPPAGWRRPFSVAEQHPAWGASLAAQAGVSPLAQALIRRHQQPLPPASSTLEDHLLRCLQAADDHS